MNVKMSWVKIGAQAKANVNEVLNSGWLSRRKFIPLFEQKIAKLHGAKRGIFVNSGTDALRIALLTLKEIHKWRNGDEVLVPAVTFVATANAVIQANLKIRFVDVELSTCNMDPNSLAQEKRSKAVCSIPVHIFGLPANTAQIKTSSRHVVEDSCETFGVHQLIGDIACFSFFQAHHVQTGVGGMIVTNNPHYERVARSYMNHGRNANMNRYEFQRIGYSSRATEMEAALGMGALQEFSSQLKIRQDLAYEYDQRLCNVKELDISSRKHRIVDSSWMFFPCLINKGSRDKMMSFLLSKGIESRQAMPLIDQKCYVGMYKQGSCPNAELWTKRGILFPLHPLMDSRQVRYVAAVIKEFYAKTN